MAIQWGSREGTNSQRVGVEFTQSPSTIAASTTSVTITMKLYMDALYATDDNQTLYYKSPHFTDGSVDYHMTQGSHLVKTITRTFTPSHTGTTDTDCNLSISGHYGGATPTKSATHTTAARPYYAPSAVTEVLLNRISATTSRVTWSNNPTADGPYSSISIDKTTDPTWATWSSVEVGPTATSYDDTNSSTTVREWYRVVPYGPGGWASRTYSNVNETVPVQPTSSSATANVTSGSYANTLVATSNLSTVFGSATVDYDNDAESASIELWNSAANTWIVFGSVVPSGTQVTTLTGLSDDRSYQARCRTSNTAGSSGYAYSNTFFTRPAAPTGPTTLSVLNAVRNASSANQIDLSWVNTSAIDTGTEVWWSSSSDNGVTWSAWSKVATTAANSTTYQHKNLNTAHQHKYYVSNVNVTGGTTLRSTALLSSPITLISPPIEPTLLGGYVSRTDYVDVNDGTITLSWRHNPVDGSAQRDVQFRHRVDGGSWIVDTVGDTDTSETITGIANGHTYEWQVRTWGAETTGGTNDPTIGDGGSPWSAVGIFKTSAKPVCAITTPKAPTIPGGERIWPSAGMTVVHTYSDAENKAQKAHRTELWNAAGTSLLWFSEKTGTDLTEDIVYTLANDVHYIVKKLVQDSDGLWSSVASCKIDVQWETPPAVPDPPTDIDVTISGTTATLAWTAPASSNVGVVGDNVPGHNPWNKLLIERWSSTTSWVTLKTINATTTGSTTDTVEANRKYRYRIMAQAHKASIAEPDVMMISSSPMLTQTDYLFTTPASPTWVVASQPEEVVIVSWENASTYPCKMEVQRRNDDIVGSDFIEIGVTDAEQEQFADLTPSPGTTYTYRCRSQYETLLGAWTTADAISTKGLKTLVDQSISIPPVRRNGPRESEKENIEAAEFGFMVRVVTEKLDGLVNEIKTMSGSIGPQIDAMYMGNDPTILNPEYSGIEAARIKTQIK